MASNLLTIGFDADDTLWHNERFFKLTQERFAALLQDHVEADHLDARLLEAERRNIGHYGFGVKGFVLSMIETAIEVTEGRVPGSVIGEILKAGQDMLAHPIELLPHAQDAVARILQVDPIDQNVCAAKRRVDVSCQRLRDAVPSTSRDQRDLATTTLVGAVDHALASA